MTQVKILILTKYGMLGASSRLRTLQYIPWLQTSEFQIETHELLQDSLLKIKYQSGSYPCLALLNSYWTRLIFLFKRGCFDLLWIEKEALPWFPASLELALLQGIPYVLDYDDAIFHNYDQHRHALVRHLYSKRVDRLMSQAALVIGGNQYLAQRAVEAGSTWVEVIPTVIDLNRYNYLDIQKSSNSDKLPRIVWIGSPSTVRYLEILREPLQNLAKLTPFVLRIIGGNTFEMDGIQIETIPWTEDSEVTSITSADIGVMPLFDSPWERGKCGYKLIQYMACGLPVVASPIGVNTSIVQNGVNGFLAKDTTQWLNALEQLFKNPGLRMRMGRAGRQRVEEQYCLQVTGPKIAKLLNEAAHRI